MSYSNTKITIKDVEEWLSDFTKAYEVIECIEELSNEHKNYFRSRMRDALFLVAYVESQLGIDVNGDVYDRARELQCEARLRANQMRER